MAVRAGAWRSTASGAPSASASSRTESRSWSRRPIRASRDSRPIESLEQRLMLAVTPVSGTITQNAHWSGTINVTGSVTINDGVTLTIDPGTVIKTALQQSITAHGTILAQGSAAQPIIFTSTHDESVGDVVDAGNGNPSCGRLADI